MNDLMIRVVLSALAASYLVFVFQKKRGPFGIFSRIRSLAFRLPDELRYHILCPTCLALSSGLVLFVLSYVATWLVAIVAVAGLVMVLHGLAGHWHSAD